ncbi:hemin uptake protein HemP [Polynucleobacter sp. 31A-FELB]|nr:hemin uptake protein HemP [Polynucleobacter sp. 31A-FELB]
MATRKVNSKELFGDSQSLLIEHEGTTYCLRATKFGKLLITK